MEGTEVFETGLIYLGALLLMVVLLWAAKSIGILTEFAENIAQVIFTTGNSSESFLLKVIISILCPPLLILFLFRFLRDSLSIGNDEEEEQRKNEIESNRLKENERLWREHK